MPANSAGHRLVSPENLLGALKWRYSTKKFDPTKKIAPRDWATLEEALVLAPSSFGLQPWKFLVINDPAMREKLKAVAWHQSQITDAAHLVVFAARKGLNADDVQKLIDRIGDVRNIPLHQIEQHKKAMLAWQATKTPEHLDSWSARQTYIALGIFLASAAMLGIDACPMEGFDPKKFDEILGLGEMGYGSIALAAAGYRAADDHFAEMPKVRFEAKDVIVGV